MERPCDLAPMPLKGEDGPVAGSRRSFEIIGLVVSCIRVNSVAVPNPYDQVEVSGIYDRSLRTAIDLELSQAHGGFRSPPPNLRPIDDVLADPAALRRRWWPEAESALVAEIEIVSRRWWCGRINSASRQPLAC